MRGVLRGRWCPFGDDVLSERSPATGNALHRSVLQWETSHCDGKGNRCAEFVPLPLFSMKMVRVTTKKRYLLRNTSVRLQVPPVGALGCRGCSCALSLQQSEQTFQLQNAGWLSWERLCCSQKEKGAET